MAKDVIYTNGVIAVKENKLLGEKIAKLAESNADDAFRMIVESGFGKGAAFSSVYEYEELIQSEERDLDAFIGEYAPSEVEKEYFLSPRDFHNAKAVVKGLYLNEPCDKMLAPDGLIPAEELKKAIAEGEYGNLPDGLKEAVEECNKLIEENESVSGADIGVIFDKAAYAELFLKCSRNSFLKRALAAKVDMSNILTAMRSADYEHAEKSFFRGGKLKEEHLQNIFGDDGHALDNTPYKEFYRLCMEAKKGNLPFTEAERAFDTYETKLLYAKRHELKNKQPFLYYVLRRRAEIADVRILFVCLMAGMQSKDIKKRLRSYYDR